MELPMPPPNFQYAAVVIDPPQPSPAVEDEPGKDRKKKARRRHRPRSEPRDGADRAAPAATQIDTAPSAERGRNRKKEKRHKHRWRHSSAPAVPESPLPPLPPLPHADDESADAGAAGEGSDEKSTGRVKSVCPICYATQANVMTLCGHGFCYQCLKAWLGDHDSCPVCRCFAQMEPDIPAHQVHGAVIYTSPSGRRIALRVDLNALLFGVKCRKCNTACIRACRIRDEPETMQCGVCSAAVAPPEDVTVLRALLVAKTSPSDVGFKTKSLPPEPAPYQRHILAQDRQRPAYTRQSARCLVISSFLIICVALPCIYGGVKLLHTLGFILALGLLIGSVCCIAWGIAGVVWGCRRMRQAEARDPAPEENAHNPEP